MLKQLMAIAMTMGVGFTMSACGKSSSESGDVSHSMWGLLNHSSRHLINQPNGATIRLCGSNLETLGWAINSWGNEIGVNFNFIDDCSNPQIKSFAESDPEALSGCAANKDAGMYTQTYSDPMLLVDCGNGKTTLQADFLHESGHLWGLCDQYEKAMKVNCATTTAPTDSVMAANRSLSLSDDDIEGIKALNRQYGRQHESPSVYIPESSNPSVSYPPAGSGCLSMSELMDSLDCTNADLQHREPRVSRATCADLDQRYASVGVCK